MTDEIFNERLALPHISGLGGNNFYPAKSVAPQNGVIGHKVAGDGDIKAIFLHDWSVSSDGDYAFASAFLDGSQLEIAFADVRGYGASINMIGNYTAEEISADVRNLANSLSWDRFSVVGHSMTGMVVQKIMSDIPERLDRVIAAVPVPASGAQPDKNTFAFFETVPFDDDAFRTAMHALTSAQYGDAWVNNKLLLNRRSVNAEAMKAYVSMFAKSDYSGEVSGNETPLLVIFGSYDGETLRKESTGQLFEDWYPNLTSYVMKTGHYPMVEAPVEYAKIVQDFLQA
ncbi:alpha/beta fold hydrolase [Pelagibius sp. Alg239-R121]|uniref:alpha/beta fold hydrolase n=1 Tax=Pelagibius sp. Alg239-R121 TaxID=2993448 RepID=UPI0024A6BA24|nr:alpha/beta hydrolase [Pelagibius sp. Alg239-R121]